MIPFRRRRLHPARSLQPQTLPHGDDLSTLSSVGYEGDAIQGLRRGTLLQEPAHPKYGSGASGEDVLAFNVGVVFNDDPVGTYSLSLFQEDRRRVRTQILWVNSLQQGGAPYIHSFGATRNYAIVVVPPVFDCLPIACRKRFKSVFSANALVGSFARANWYPSEPIFVADLDGTNEDDGVLLIKMYLGEERQTALLILNAVTMEQVAVLRPDGHISPIDFYFRHRRSGRSSNSQEGKS